MSSFFEITFIVGLCVISFILGQKNKDSQQDQNSQDQKMKKYFKLDQEMQDQDAHDEESKGSLIDNNQQYADSQKQVQEQNTRILQQQKEIDTLIQEIQGYKSREKKYQAEVEFLKTKSQSQQQSQQQQNNRDDEKLMSDQELNSLIDDTAANIKDSEQIDEDELSKEIEKELI